jgi:hypothetical protein
VTAPLIVFHPRMLRILSPEGEGFTDPLSGTLKSRVSQRPDSTKKTAILPVFDDSKTTVKYNCRFFLDPVLAPGRRPALDSSLRESMTCRAPFPLYASLKRIC